MICYCCGALATDTTELTHQSWVKGLFGDFERVAVVIRAPACAECAGLEHTPGPTVGIPGYKGKQKQERTFVLHCPTHGTQGPTDVADVDWHKAKVHWKSAFPIKTRAGRRVMVLDYTERSA